ncbi:MAG: S-formylglutathione hydrolase [Rhodospirillales bacterium]|nr:S-formylglutathione hydrolase [Rhodospirillales bacterium]MBO6787973.1 S-formylglutathione hydrolase [Rhodospirillales bacterium]
MTYETVSENKCFGGTQGVYSHTSQELGCDMKFAVFTPPQAESEPRPVVFWLSGLTCTEENFTVKAGAQRMAAELGLVIVAPDTSPRGDDVPDDADSYDFGKGAGFYVDATREPWSKNYRMYSYVTGELPALIFKHFPARADRQGIMGHSMGGHGALTIALKNPDTYASVSAFSPIVAPSEVPWGQKALSRYLGDDTEAWADYDATRLILAGCRHPSKILIDQGTADNFLEEQLRPELFVDACENGGQHFDLRMQPGYDHSYFFIATFIEDHLRHHAALLDG